MAKSEATTPQKTGGVKKIQILSKDYYPNISSTNSYKIKPDTMVSFGIKEWLPGTLPADMNKEVTWMLQEPNRQVIVKQSKCAANEPYGIKISRKLCGPYSYYLEASISGKRDLINDTGLRVGGWCQPKVISSKWSTKLNGDDVRQSVVFSYGQIVFLHLETEGMNGELLTIEIYNRTTLAKDKQIWVYDKIRVIDGEVNLEIRNTAAWMPNVSNIQNEEQFYIKVKNGNGIEIADNNGDTPHARFLRIKKELLSSEIGQPENHSPAKVFQPEPNPVRYDPCKFDEIKISEAIEKDGKVKIETIVVFDKGKKLSNLTYPEDLIQRSIYFDFDSANIKSSDKNTLNNILNFILNYQGSSITVSGYACVIGKNDYNKKLSQKRSDAVKKFFTDGGIDPARIKSFGYGEINPTDDKKKGDDIKLKDEKTNQESRRADISFVLHGHNAESVVYETIAPDKHMKKDLTIDIKGHTTKECYRQKEKHKEEFSIIDVGEELDNGDKPTIHSGSTVYKIHSNLSEFNIFPIKYIWSKATKPYQYWIHVHSCRYYSLDKNPALKIRVYPDIKWKLAFELKIDIEHKTSVNMPAGPIFEKHQEESRKAGYARWLMNKQGKVPIKIGLGLKAEWNNGKQKADLVANFKEKIEPAAEMLATSVEVIQNVINICRNVAKGTSIPLTFGVEYPKIEAVASWYLKREPEHLQVAVVGEISFGAKPLIGANVTIDLIAAIVTAVSYATTGSPAIVKIVETISKAGKRVGAEISAEAKFYGQLEVILSDLGINSITGIKGGKAMIGGKMGLKVTIKAKAGDIKIENKVLTKIIPKISAEAQADAAFGGKLTLDSDNQGIFVEPTLEFQGLKVSLDIKFSVDWFSRSYHVEDIIVPSQIKPLGKKYITK